MAFAYLAELLLGLPFAFLTHMINLDGEANLPAWYSSIKMFLLALLLASFGCREFKRSPDRASWSLLLISAVFAVLSLDEVAQIHEWLGVKSDILFPSGNRAGSLFSKTGIWMILMGPPLIVLMFHLIKGAGRYLKNQPHVSRKFIIGLVVFLGSAMVTEVLSNFTVGSRVGSVFQVAAEELGEMVGVTILIWSIYNLLALHQVKIDFGRERDS